MTKIPISYVISGFFFIEISENIATDVEMLASMKDKEDK